MVCVEAVVDSAGCLGQYTELISVKFYFNMAEKCLDL